MSGMNARVAVGIALVVVGAVALAWWLALARESAIMPLAAAAILLAGGAIWWRGARGQ